MTVKKFFEMLESANEFKALLKEQKTKVSIITNDVACGTVYTFEQFDELLSDLFCAEVKEEILSATISATVECRTFRIPYHHLVDRESKSLKLFID